MDFKEVIERYIPVNEQEEKDKQAILMCINNFNDVLTRKNVVCHLTSSAFVVNNDKDKALMAYHNIYKSWAWTGGHMDGDNDFLKVAFKELEEETGLKNARLLYDGIASIDILTVEGHIKRGEFVSPHLHLSIAYLFEGDESEKLSIKEDENSGVKWIPIKDLKKCTEREPFMLKVYKKILDRDNIKFD
ncbi:NUDIX hydrolase [Clostridium sp. Ade.TY]|uniref:NUDIX hydrolase n=1 Tax=Clostridium sp. Ade.TY TaxID=1391647 RepID=UPI000429E7C4|nr:NUDIX hydrolase [Clostridium sp. Ade.TY]